MPQHKKTYRLTCMSNKVSNQPAHIAQSDQSIRYLYEDNYILQCNASQNALSGDSDQPDQNLRWAHICEVTFADVKAHVYLFQFNRNSPDVCRNLQCTNPSNSDYYRRFVAAHGTPCGEGMVRKTIYINLEASVATAVDDIFNTFSVLRPCKQKILFVVPLL